MYLTAHICPRPRPAARKGGFIWRSDKAKFRIGPRRNRDIWKATYHTLYFATHIRFPTERKDDHLYHNKRSAVQRKVHKQRIIHKRNQVEKSVRLDIWRTDVSCMCGDHEESMGESPYIRGPDNASRLHQLESQSYYLKKYRFQWRKYYSKHPLVRVLLTNYGVGLFSNLDNITIYS